VLLNAQRFIHKPLGFMLRKKMNITVKFILIASLLISINLRGQQDTINQFNDKGVKVGFWREYHENGIIDAEGSYKIIERQLSIEEIFFYDLQEQDSIIKSPVKNGTWKYFDNDGRLAHIKKYHNGTKYFNENYYYNENGNLVRTERNGRQTLFGIGKDIEINQLYYFISGNIGNTSVNKIYINSLCNHSTQIWLKSNTDRINFKSDFLTIEENTNLSIPFTYSIEPGGLLDYIEVIFINPDTNKIKIEIESYGYHLSSSQLQLTFKQLKSYGLKGDKLLYYREYEECEMKIFKYSSNLGFQRMKDERIEPMIIIPLSLERNEIDLKTLKKGEYLLTTTDFMNDIEMMIEFIKE